MRFVVSVDAGSGPVIHQLRAAQDAHTADLLAALPPGRWELDGTALAPDDLTELGRLLTAGSALRRMSPPGGPGTADLCEVVAELVVCGGRDAGRRVALTAGPVSVDTAGGQRMDLLVGSEGSVWLHGSAGDGLPGQSHEAVPWAETGVLRVPGQAWCVRSRPAPTALEGVGVDRRSRLRTVRRAARLPAPTESALPARDRGALRDENDEADAASDREERGRPPRRRPLPVATLVGPVAMGTMFALTTHSRALLAVALAGPLLSGGAVAVERRQQARAEAAQRVAQAHRVAATAARRRLLQAQRSRRLHRDHPDPATLLAIARSHAPGGPSSSADPRLWARRPADPHFLDLRLGLDAHGDPAVLRLRPGQVLGLAGPGARAALACVLGHLLVGCSPAELAIRLPPPWRWADLGPAEDWLPLLLTAHVRSAVAAEASETDVALDVVVAGDVVADEVVALPPVLQQPGATIVLADRVAALPPGCDHVLEVALDASARWHGPGGEFPDGHLTSLSAGAGGPGDAGGGVDLLADLAAPGWLPQLAAALGPLRDAAAAGGGLPDACRLLELLDLDGGDDLALAQRLQTRWTRREMPPTVLGMGASGRAEFDLRGDGPHLLIGGTTGSGKSELLVTLIASLAADTPPDALSFLLIDYKGGAAFSGCVGLPHVTGVLTDLDPSLAARGLRSLRAELLRRERLLAGAGVSDVDAYRRSGPHCAPLPRLVIVVDEFAGLASELPGFLPGLVAVAQRGRSLGVHLVLATQRPSGVVSAEIRANVTTRIALRVSDPADSLDLVDGPDAARLPPRRPGRMVIRRPGGLDTVQCARVTGLAADDPEHGCALELRPLVATDLAAAGHAAAGAASGPTDLDRLVRAARRAASQTGLTPVPPPWLPPLPARLPWHHLIAGTPSGADTEPIAGGATAGGTSTQQVVANSARIAFGLTDLPDEQAQRPAVLDLQGGGHLLVAGTARSGRTTTLLAVAAAAARDTSPQDLHVYALDGPRGELEVLRALPHTGAVASPARQPEHATRVLAWLRGELERRGRGRRGADPALLLLVDGTDRLDPDGLATLIGLLRDGPACGLTVVVTCDRSGSGPLLGWISDRLVLRLADRADGAFFGLAVAAPGPEQPAGRGLRGPTAVQVQVADPVGDRDAHSVFEEVGQRWVAAGRSGPAAARTEPYRIEALPVLVTDTELRRSWPWARPSPSPAATGRLADGTDALRGDGPACLAAPQRWIPVGLSGDQPCTVGLSDGDGSAALVIGPSGSGRSSCLLTLARACAAAGEELVVFAGPDSPLRAVRGAGLRALLDVTSDPITVERALADGPVVAIVDDAEELMDGAVSDQLDQLIARAARRGDRVVLAATAEGVRARFRGPLSAGRRDRTGILLHPAPGDGEILGVRLPRTTGGPLPPGRGVLVRRGRVQPIQVARPADSALVRVAPLAGGVEGLLDHAR